MKTNLFLILIYAVIVLFALVFVWGSWRFFIKTMPPVKVQIVPYKTIEVPK